jgi:hypothetical protein
MKRAICLLIVLAVAGSASAVIVPAPIAKWDFEGNLKDSIGTSNGTWHGTVDPVYVASVPGLGQALQLNPVTPTSLTNQWVNAGTKLDFATTGAGGTADGVTAMAWVYYFPEGLALTDPKIVGNSDGLLGGYKLAIYNKKVEMEFRGPSGQVLTPIRNATGGTTLLANTWYHVTVVFSDAGDYIRTYVNGVLDREALNVTQAMSANGGELMRIGTETPGYNSGRVLRGYVDDVRIYNTALSQEQIMQIVPEPATITVLGIGGLTLLRRRRA